MHFTSIILMVLVNGFIITASMNVRDFKNELTNEQLKEADYKIRENEELEQTFVDLAHEMAKEGVTPDDDKLLAEMKKALSKKPRTDRQYLYDRYLNE